MVIRRTPALTALLVAVLAASGCARDAGTGDSAGAPAPAPATSSAAPAPESTVPPEPDKSGAAGAQTISGTVTAGVEPGCLLLTGDGGEHLLVFDDPAMRADATIGSKLTVTGEAQPGQMSTCQQGIPFRVTSVRQG